VTEAIILGIVQGITEPLPVSSSAHLVIIPAFPPGFQPPGVACNVLLHLGTLLAVCYFLRVEIGDLIVSLIPNSTKSNIAPERDAGEKAANRKSGLLIVIATIMTDIIGLLFKDRIERLFESMETAARSSFLLSIPAIVKAVSLKSADLLRLTAGELPVLGTGFVAAATGFRTLKLLFAMLHRTGLAPCAGYCCLLGFFPLTVRGIRMTG
jgi:undecaprenyl pyrophosphate phosphatase UppP